MITEFLYTTLGYANIIIGIYAGIWFIRQSVLIGERTQRYNYIVLGLVNIYFGVCYFWFAFVLKNIAAHQITSALLRPGNTLLLLVPFLISYRSRR